MKFETVQDNVEYLLKTDKKTKDSDKLLYVKIVDIMCPGIVDKPFREVMLSDIPSYETVRRCRQKLQEKQPWLKGSERVHDYRAANEEDYRNYALTK